MWDSFARSKKKKKEEINASKIFKTWSVSCRSGLNKSWRLESLHIILYGEPLGLCRPVTHVLFITVVCIAVSTAMAWMQTAAAAALILVASSLWIRKSNRQWWVGYYIIQQHITSQLTFSWGAFLITHLISADLNRHLKYNLLGLAIA